MKKSLLSYSVYLLLFLGHPIAFAQVEPRKSITFVWNAYCPYTCKVSNKALDTNEVPLTGFAMEVVRAVYQDSPYNVKYKYVDSWNRAMSSVESGISDGIVFSFHVSNVTERYVVPKLSLAVENSTNFLVLKDSKYKLNGIESLSQFAHIGVYKGTIFSDPRIGEFEKQNPEKFTYLYGSDIFARALKMLRRGRISTWEDSMAVLNYKIYKHNINDVRIERLITLSSSLGGPLFTRHNKHSQEYAQYFSQGLHKLRKSGRLAIILQRYGQQDLVAKQQD